MSQIRIAVIGVGNCAGSLIEGLHHYRNQPEAPGLLFPRLGGYTVGDIAVVCAFDIAEGKIGKEVGRAIYAKPNNFVRLGVENLEEKATVHRGPTLDGNPEHLQVFVTESSEEPVNVVDILRRERVDIVVNFLPTGSVEATEHYGLAALEAGAAFVNCIPTIFAQRADVQAMFAAKNLPVLGDDVKSQVGSTIIHRTLLNMLLHRGAVITRTSQVNVGGNTDFANFVHRAETKLVSKRKSLAAFVNDDTPSHVGHHYDPTQGPLKRTSFIIDAEVFGGSKVSLVVQLQSDDKPNCSGSVIDLVRIAKYEKDQCNGGVIDDGCAYYVKSQPTPMSDDSAYEAVNRRWGSV